MKLEVLLEREKKTMLCKIGRILASLEPRYRDALTNMLAKPWAEGGFTDDAVAKAMNDAGLATGATTIRIHRAGKCVCGRVVNG